MASISFNPQFIKSAVCDAGKAKSNFFDADCRGLMLEVRKSGGKTFSLRYQDNHGKTRQLRLADSTDVTLTQARVLADKARNQMVMGIDPRESRAELKKVPTVGSFILDSYLPFVKSYKRSWVCDESLLRNHVAPVWGKLFMDEVTKSDVVKLITEQRETHAAGSCNRLLILLRYMFNLALKWETPGVKSNPTAGFDLLPNHNTMDRFLSHDEAIALSDELGRSQNPMLQYIVPMLILTGARKREVLDARWEDFDLERNAWHIPTTKSGRPRHVPLSTTVVSLLKQVPHVQGCPWPFANPKTAKPYVSIFASWDTARINAGLAEVRIHDLRHTYASFLVNAGRTLYEVQKILGHTQVRTTQRYAHLSQDTLVAAANEAAKSMPNMLPPVPATAEKLALWAENEVLLLDR